MQTTTVNLSLKNSQSIFRPSNILSWTKPFQQWIYVSHTHMGFLVGTHPQANPELPSVHREERGLTSHLPSSLHNTPKYHVCSLTTNVDRQTDTVIYCFAWPLWIFFFQRTPVCVFNLNKTKHSSCSVWQHKWIPDRSGFSKMNHLYLG